MSSSSLFGNKLREALKSANLSQKEASSMLGISPGSMTNYVHGRIPEAEILLNISRLCNKPMEWFLTGQDVVRYEKINSELGVRIRDAMVWNGMTIEEFAESLGVTEEEIDRICKGFLADPGVLADLCRILNVTADWLLSGEGEGPPYRGEFLSAHDSFFSALATLIANVTLIDREEIRQALAGNALAEIIQPQSGLEDEFLASLQVLLRSPAWTRRLQHGRSGKAWPVTEYAPPAPIHFLLSVTIQSRRCPLEPKNIPQGMGTSLFEECPPCRRKRRTCRAIRCGQIPPGSA